LLVICKLMRIRIGFRIQLIPLMWIRIRILIYICADADPSYQNDATHADADSDPQLCLQQLKA
jgi:hypothetical protein